MNDLEHDDGSVLSNQIQLISDVLSEVLIEQSGRPMFQLKETIRLLTKSYRENVDSEHIISDLRVLVESLPYKDLMIMVKTFSLFFRLVLILEERHITRIIVDEKKDVSGNSLLSAVLHAKKLGLRATDIISLLDLNSIKLVFSEHPTGGIFDTMESNLRSIYHTVQKLDDHNIDDLTRKKYLNTIKYHITLLWQSQSLREEKSSVFGRSKSLLYYFESSIVNSISSLVNEMSRVISYVYDDENSPTGKIDYRVPAFISLGSFIGGELQTLSDPSDTFSTIILQKQLCLRIYIKKVDELIAQLSNSTQVIGITPDLQKSLEEDAKLQPGLFVLSRMYKTQSYRMKLEFIRGKLQNTLVQLNTENDEMLRIKTHQGVGDGPIYLRSIDFLRDLRLIQNSLKRHRAKLIANGPLRDLINLVKIFGFHLASIDFSLKGSVIRNILTEVFNFAAIGNLDEMTLSQRMQCMREEISSRRPLGILTFLEEFSEESFSFIESLLIIKEVIDKISPRAVGSFIINECTDESEVLGLLLICKELNLSLFGEQSSIDIVPHFSNYGAMQNSSRFFKSLFMDPNYMDHLQKRGYIQEIYLDYTNCVKRMGFFKAHSVIFNLQQELTNVFGNFNIRPRFFLGRGSSISRGFHSARLGILSLPPGSIGNLKIEENGEILSSLFSNPELTTLNLEQIANGLLLHAITDKFMPGIKNPSTPRQEYKIAFEKIADRNAQVYLDFLSSPLMVDLFVHSTPSDLIAEIFGVSSQLDDFPNKIDDRVWIHSWNQSRNIFPMYFGVGTALNEYIEQNGADLLQEMFLSWPQFRSLVEYIQMVLIKIDFKLMDVYLTLCHMDANPLLPKMREEYELTKSVILQITKQKELMENMPGLKAAIKERLPHLDTLGILQVSLLKHWRNKRDPRYLKGLIPTINSVIAGLKNTG